MNNVKEYSGYLVRGILMGAADVIPGVSGGTIAFITGIYEKLIQSLNEVDLTAFKYLFTLRIRKLIDKINGYFLLVLMIGVFVAVFSLASRIQYLLQNYSEAVWAFFFGLILGSVVVIAKHVKQWKISYILALIIGGTIAWWLSSTNVIRTPDTPLFVFFAGVISIIAMILPGISGSFILVIMDKYRYIIDIVAGISVGLKNMTYGLFSADLEMVGEAWKNTEFMPLLIFELGTLTGIIGFSKVLNWLFEKFHTITIALLTGFLIGSLYKVWPWKVALQWYEDSKGVRHPLIENNILPSDYDRYFVLSIALAAIGFALVYVIELLSEKKKSVE